MFDFDVILLVPSHQNTPGLVFGLTFIIFPNVLDMAVKPAVFNLHHTVALRTMKASFGELIIKQKQLMKHHYAHILVIVIFSNSLLKPLAQPILPTKV